MELHEKSFASRGLAGAALGTGIAGLSLGVLNGGGGILNGPDGEHVEAFTARIP